MHARTTAASSGHNARDAAHDDATHANSSSAKTVPSSDRWTRPRAVRSRRLSRRPVTLAAAFLLALTAVIVPASTATATNIHVACGLGTFNRAFSPAVTVAAQAVTVNETSDYGTCVVGPSAAGALTVTVPLACVTLTAGPATTETITWRDAAGGTSTISWSAPTIAGQTVTFTGTVTAGRYVNDAATKVTSGVSYVAVVAPCLLGTPISSTTGLVDGLLLND